MLRGTRRRRFVDMGLGIIKITPQIVDVQLMDLITDTFRVVDHEYDAFEGVHVLRCDSGLFTEADPSTVYTVEITRSSHGHIKVSRVFPAGAY